MDSLDNKKPKIRTHEQVSVSERRRMPRGLNEAGRAYRADYMPKRTWSNNKAERHTKFKFSVPEWLLPKNGVHVFDTITASIVWGICGRMADMPEYES